MLQLRLSGIALFTAACLSVTACGANDGGDEANAAPPASGTSAPAPPASAPPAQDSGLSPNVSTAGLNFTLPSGWDREQPSSRMRAAQAAINGSGGAGQLTVFFFGAGGGGSVDANLERWIGQMGDTEGEAQREQFEAGEFLVTTISQAGTLKASTMGTFPSTDQPNYALLGAVVEGAGGPWFFKAVGPEATMSEQAAAFRTMLEGVSN